MARDQSIEIPAARIGAPFLAISVSVNLPRILGRAAVGRGHQRAGLQRSCSRTDGVSIASTVASRSRLITGAGVPFGTKKPKTVDASNSLKPCSQVLG